MLGEYRVVPSFITKIKQNKKLQNVSHRFHVCVKAPSDLSMTSFLLIATMLFQGSPTILQTIAGACLCENLGKCSVQCQGTSSMLKNTHRHGMHSFTNKQTENRTK